MLLISKPKLSLEWLLGKEAERVLSTFVFMLHILIDYYMQIYLFMTVVIFLVL